MRGVKSYAMLLCASSAEGKDAGIEFVKPPKGCQAGDRVYFEGEKYESGCFCSLGWLMRSSLIGVVEGMDVTMRERYGLKKESIY